MIAKRVAHLQRGAGLVETMVGILVGLLVVLVVYNMLAVAEGYKRSTTNAADAQVTGLISHLVVGLDAAQGGGGFTSAYEYLINCHKNEGDVTYTAETSLKPISVLITPGVTANDSDSFMAWIGASPHVIWPVAVRLPSPATAGDPIVVQSPNGFATPAKVSLPTGTDPWWAVMIANDGSGRCGLIQVIGATGADDTTGEVTLTQGSPATTIPYVGQAINDTGTGALLQNLGPVRDGALRVRYDIDAVTSTLRTTNCLTPTGCAGGTPNPIAQNVVWMKVQYGIDTSPPLADGSFDASVDCWSPADATCAVGGVDWAPDTVKNAGDPAFPAVPATFLNRIVAIRIGLVVRSDEPDRRNPALFTAPAQTDDGVTGTRQAEYLFNCAANTNAGCPGRVQVPAGAVAPAVLRDGYRYRTYEAVIPLRNSIFVATLPPPP